MITIVPSYNKFTSAIEWAQPANKKEWAVLGLSCGALLISRNAATTTAVGVAVIGYLGYKWLKAEKPTELKAVEKLPDPNEAQEIYTPPRPSERDLAGLAQHAEKIAKLKQNKDVMGIVFVPNTEGQLTPIYIKYFKANPQTESFSAYSLNDDRQLGFAQVHPFLESNDYLKQGYWAGERPEEYEGYGSSKEEVGKVLLEQLTNQSKDHKNIGVVLNKAIHQHYQTECQGRIVIDAVRKTHPYHYKLGFRADNPEFNALCANYARESQRPDRDLGSVMMILPEQACRLWMEEVQKNPIGFPF